MNRNDWVSHASLYLRPLPLYQHFTFDWHAESNYSFVLVHTRSQTTTHTEKSFTQRSNSSCFAKTDSALHRHHRGWGLDSNRPQTRKMHIWYVWGPKVWESWFDSHSSGREVNQLWHYTLPVKCSEVMVTTLQLSTEGRQHQQQSHDHLRCKQTLILTIISKPPETECT